MQIKPPDLIAAVDLGSNSFHMIVSKLRDGELHTIDRLKETVRLAAGLDDMGRLTEQAQTDALECLERFGERLRDIPDDSIRAVGTNTLRRARNAAEFLIEAERALGHTIDIISGVEEARLIYLGVARTLSSDSKRRLVMDIGGGSTEFIIGSGSKPITKESLHMGCVSMSNRQFPKGKISNKRFQRATVLALQEIEPIQLSFRNLGWDEAVGSSGTLRTVVRVLNSTGWSKNGITLDGLEQLVQAMLEAGHIDNLDLPELNADRKPVFAGGVAIVYAAFKSLQIERLKVSNGALREGLLYDLLGRIFREDTRANSVDRLAERYHIDFKHASLVAATARYCLDQVSLPDGLDRAIAVQRLEWAAMIHEIGQDISQSQYHKHGAYVLENADLAGFGRQEQKVIAILVRTHRRKFQLKLFESLSAPWNEAVITLAIVLRLSVVLHRSRSIDALPDFELALEKQSLKITFPKDWLEQHRLTHADLDQEAAYLADAGIGLEWVS